MFLVLTGVIYDSDGHLSQGRAHIESVVDDDQLPGRYELGREWARAFIKFWCTGSGYEQRNSEGW